MNNLTHGDIIKNIHYQKILEVLINNYLDHNVDEESLKLLLEGISNTKRETKISHKNKFKKCQTKNFHKKKNNLLMENLLSPINSTDIKESKVSSNKKKSLNMKRVKTKRNLPNNNDKNKKVKFEKIEYYNGKEKKEIHTEIKKGINDTEIRKIQKIKNNTEIKKPKHSKTRIEQKISKLKKLQTKKDDNIEGQVILTSSMNVINETENDKNLKNNKLVLLNKDNNKISIEQEPQKDSLDKNNKKCIIF